MGLGPFVVNTGLALLVIGLLDALMGLAFTFVLRRVELVMEEWPEPAFVPRGLRQEYEAMVIRAFTLRTCRVVCFNTGASFTATGLILLLGVV